MLWVRHHPSTYMNSVGGTLLFGAPASQQAVWEASPLPMQATARPGRETPDVTGFPPTGKDFFKLNFLEL